MKILILNWRDISHPLAGGAEIATHEHAKGWVRAGHSVVQISSLFSDAKNTEEIDGVTFIRTGNHYTVHLNAIVRYLIKYQHTFDLVVDEFHFIPFFTPLFVRTKILGFIHEVARELWLTNIFFPANIIGSLVEPHIFRFYKKVPFMTVSESTKKDLLGIGIPNKNIHVIHNGISALQSKKTKSHTPVIMYLGRLALDKGVEDALAAFQQIHAKLPESKFWIVGNPENASYYKRLVMLIHQSTLQEHIILHGHVSEQQKFDLLKQAWILIHPSIKEGWGLTAIEAASQETPTIAYQVHGLTDSIKHNKTGILVPHRNMDLLSKQTIELFDNTVHYTHMKKDAAAWSKEFTWKKSISESLALIEHI